MTRVQAVIATASLAAVALMLLVIGALAANPFGDADSIGRVAAALCALTSVPAAGAGAFIAYRTRGKKVWLATAATLTGGFFVYVVFTFPSEFL